jgi:hypothetical protein
MDEIVLVKDIALSVRRFNFESLCMIGIASSECTFSEPVFNSINEFSIISRLYFPTSSTRNAMGIVHKNPVSNTPIFALQLKRSLTKQNTSIKSKVYTRTDEMTLMLLSTFIELKLSLVLESIEKANINNRLTKFIEMEGTLLTERTYYDFYYACKEWLPKISVFSYASIMFYNSECNYSTIYRSMSYRCQ